MPRRVKGEYTNEVLERCPVRVTRFLSGLAAIPEVLDQLVTEAGLMDADLAEGRTLLLACLTPPAAPSARMAASARVAVMAPAPLTGAPSPGRAPGRSSSRGPGAKRAVPPPASHAEGDGRASAVEAPRDTAPHGRADDAHRRAWADLEAWTRPNFARYAAALRRHFPSAADHVFAGLRAGKGAESILATTTFLERVASLEQGNDPARAASRKDDRRAVELLALRGLTAAERARLAGLVATATRLPQAPLHVASRTRAAADRRTALIALKKWEEEWFSAAHAVVKKRASLIRLGLAARKPPSKRKKE